MVMDLRPFSGNGYATLYILAPESYYTHIGGLLQFLTDGVGWLSR